MKTAARLATPAVKSMPRTPMRVRSPGGAGIGNVARSKTPRGEGLVPRSRQSEYQPRSRAAV